MDTFFKTLRKTNDYKKSYAAVEQRQLRRKLDVISDFKEIKDAEDKFHELLDLKEKLNILKKIF